LKVVLNQGSKIMSINRLQQHLTTNTFDWYKDSINLNGRFTFKVDGTYVSDNFASGKWQVIDAKTFWKKNVNGDMYII